jgi:hypothetical protein
MCRGIHNKLVQSAPVCLRIIAAAAPAYVTAPLPCSTGTRCISHPVPASLDPPAHPDARVLIPSCCTTYAPARNTYAPSTLPSLAPPTRCSVGAAWCRCDVVLCHSASKAQCRCCSQVHSGAYSPVRNLAWCLQWSAGGQRLGVGSKAATAHVLAWSRSCVHCCRHGNGTSGQTC